MKRPRAGKKTWEKPVRVRVMDTENGIPPSILERISEEISECKMFGRSHLCFALNELPISLNHQYDHTQFRKKFFNPRTKKVEIRVMGGKKLKQEAHDFRAWVLQAIGADRFTWKPTGPLSCYILFQSPKWITKERKVRQVDADNKVKPLLDAIEQALETPDELVWELHTYKILGPKERTIVYLFDLGDVVEYHKF